MKLTKIWVLFIVLLLFEAENPNSFGIDHGLVFTDFQMCIILGMEYVSDVPSVVLTPAASLVPGNT